MNYSRKNVADKLLDYNKKFLVSALSEEMEKSKFEKEMADKENEIIALMEENRNLAKKITVYLNIASAHTMERGEVTEEHNVDTGHLSRLAIQINKNLLEDPFAKELWIETKKQLMKLDREYNNLLNSKVQVLINCSRREENSIDNIKKQRETIISEFYRFLDSAEFSDFVQQNDDIKNKKVLDGKCYGETYMGYYHIPVEFTTDVSDRIALKAPDIICNNEMIIPATLSLTPGNVIFVEYTDSTETTFIDGLHTLIMNAILTYPDSIGSIEYIDPLRLNNSALLKLSALAGEENSIISNVPGSPAVIKERLRTLLEKYTYGDYGDSNTGGVADKILFLHAFPASYDQNMFLAIRQLILNAASYGLCIIVSHNVSQNMYGSDDVISLVKSNANEFIYFDNKFKKSNKNTKDVYNFSWLTMPEKLPEEISDVVSKRNYIDRNNEYISRIGINAKPIVKGNREIRNIPYGLDTAGNTLSLDFEDSDFATFICGAARSGKSTLLHTILTGIIKNYHPDDIEIWLIDFKMTEFSRYIKHTPPHVRYIILDESPELVYDLLDRLSDILVKRQNIFKGKWQKLQHVPKEKYMPALFVVIDEFSVMSQIVADSVINGKEDYRVKLQLLLAKGAALGMHFIFSSQGFTSGTRGLNDFSKKQIQQRIAMKTEYNEIKETLDLKTLSDSDRMLMEQLPVHYALVRVPMDKNGNHIVQAKTLFISDYAKQENMIWDIRNYYTPQNRYYSDDSSFYVDKQTQIIDGSVFRSFDECKNIIEKDLAERTLIDDSVFVYLGEPKRMMNSYPIELNRSFCENILVMVSENEKMSAASVVLSLRNSLKLQDKDITLWSDVKNSVYRILAKDCRQMDIKATHDIDDICQSIRTFKNRVDIGENINECIVLLGMETVLQEMGFLDGEKGKGGIGFSIERRRPDEPGLMERLNALMQNKSASLSDGMYVGSNADTDTETKIISKAYDAREDFKYIMTRGPKYGLHFVMVSSNLIELNQTKIDVSQFRHKIMFAMPKSDAMTLTGSNGAAAVAELSEHSFRYTNGIDSLTIRPYLHCGLTWDGWRVDTDGTVDNSGNEEELLL